MNILMEGWENLKEQNISFFLAFLSVKIEPVQL